MMENVNPQTFWFSAFSDKAALEALQSKERMMSKHPKIVQGPEGIWMENQQCLPQKSHFRFMFLGYRFPGYLFCQHGPSIMLASPFSISGDKSGPLSKGTGLTFLAQAQAMLTVGVSFWKIIRGLLTATCHHHFLMETSSHCKKQKFF